MIRDAFYIASNDLRIMLKGKETLLWVFVMPFVFFFFIGKMTAGGGPMGPVSLAVQVPENAGFLADEVLDRLMLQDFNIVSEFKGESSFDDYRRRLLIPEFFTDKVLAGEQQTIIFRRRGSAPLRAPGIFLAKFSPRSLPGARACRGTRPRWRVIFTGVKRILAPELRVWPQV